MPGSRNQKRSFSAIVSAIPGMRHQQLHGIRSAIKRGKYAHFTPAEIEQLSERVRQRLDVTRKTRPYTLSVEKQTSIHSPVRVKLPELHSIEHPKAFSSIRNRVDRAIGPLALAEIAEKIDKGPVPKGIILSSEEAQWIRAFVGAKMQSFPLKVRLDALERWEKSFQRARHRRTTDREMNEAKEFFYISSIF